MRLTTAVSLAAACGAALLAQQPQANGTAQAGQDTTPPATEQRPAFRAGIDIVSLNVTVTDGTGRYVTDLTQSDFLVFENGVNQPITIFSRRENPIALSLLLDSSASMEHKLPTLQVAASEFVRRLKPADLAQVIDFDSNVTIRQAFTGNQGDLERGIQRMAAGGSTALYNAIYVALSQLKKVRVDSDEEPRRQALIVFSDGEDTSSLNTFDDVLEMTKRSETAIYTIGLRDRRSQAAGFRSSEFVLRQLAHETGGRSFFPSTIADLSAVYGQIADELSSQYSIGYVSNNPRRDGAWRPIIVQVSRPSVTSRTKRGYYAPTR
jgi:Ca-activated chloride channel family protein